MNLIINDLLSFDFQYCLDTSSDSVGMTEWVDHSKLLQWVLGSNPPSHLPLEVREENLPALFNPRQKDKLENRPNLEVGPGSHCSISLPFSVCLFCLFCFAHKTNMVRR